ncbi:MAG: lipocalin family protein, partial [Spirochaetales bacterium]|nr:lipocalin family protein [Spirochaetales bacterium]
MKKRIHLFIYVLLILTTSLLTLAGCKSTAEKKLGPLKLVEFVNIEKYLGRWYEIARYQSNFEKDLVGVTAEYTLRDDGKVNVLNSGFKFTLDGEYSDAQAVAWVPDPETPAALKVKFFLFGADYLIFGLDEENYQWALVGNNARKYLWFLSRTP